MHFALDSAPRSRGKDVPSPGAGAPDAPARRDAARRGAADARALRVALVEGNDRAALAAREWLVAAGHSAATFARGADFLHAHGRESFDLLVLGLALPDIPGERVLEAVRGDGPESLPVLAIGATREESALVAALRAGADDFLAGPLRPAEFVARVEALGRRSRILLRNAGRMRIGVFDIDLDRRELRRDGALLRLSPRDFDLAVFLFRNVGRTVSRAHILESVWRVRGALRTRTVDTYASRVRTKLGLVPEHGWRLAAIPHHGYRLDALRPEVLRPRDPLVPGLPSGEPS